MHSCWVYGSRSPGSVCRLHCWRRVYCKVYWDQGYPSSIVSWLNFFPVSFPLDFMHLIFENLLKNLVLLWTGNFKDLDEATGDYVLYPQVWEAIGQATAASGSTIPSAYGARPQNVAQDKSQINADSWSFWALYLGPVLLRGWFKSPR